MNDNVYWFITVFERFDNKWGIKNSRTWGFFSNKEDALNILRNNYTDLWETVYDYAVLEPYYEGINGYSFDDKREFFQYDYKENKYYPIGYEPEEVKHYVSFAIG